jgi:hypothetical protein
MAYKDFGGTGSSAISTQTPSERSAEARRILARLKPAVEKANFRDETLPGWTKQAMEFVTTQIGFMDLWGGDLAISPKQLFWLRDLNEKLD